MRSDPSSWGSQFPVVFQPLKSFPLNKEINSLPSAKRVPQEKVRESQDDLCSLCFLLNHSNSFILIFLHATS